MKGNKWREKRDLLLLEGHEELVKVRVALVDVKLAVDSLVVVPTGGAREEVEGEWLGGGRG